MPRPAVLAALLALLALPAAADADGPDLLRVVDIAEGGTLALRDAPGPDGAVLATIPAGQDGLASFGCQGGLDLVEWEAADEAARAEGRARRWCLVGFARHIGWARGMHLAEGGPPPALNGGRLPTLEGSEWGLAGPPAAWIGFRGGRAQGHAGCNRFGGSYETAPGRLAIGPLAATRMACPPAAMTAEQRFLGALAATTRFAASHLVLALLDAEGRVRLTLARRDAD
ncbi:hypothetical protein LNKW23_45330 [Paralimibaculum aggregatum]|uniref:DUF306 domain-containing protein n=1 Tax=Paralimibaculum aggregatum TaxID=3036245 RepID=A0ABQ6LTA5_9RHOB|nr:META domain-containing protein [Limibaculum sp. NKW23]GMG85314.1 hypothetical protein LNKW23_45330 [Limibaculum sp. NKW23]